MSKKPKKQPKKDYSTQAFIEQCVRNTQARRANPDYQNAWRKEYAESLRIGRQPSPESSPIQESCKGVAASKSIFELEWKRNDDMDKAERERLALEEIRLKAACTGPAYNKGAIQFLGKK